MPSLRVTSITLESFNGILARYENTVPERLHDLDSQRYSSIPAALAKRTTGEGAPHLSKPEVEKLVEWKL
jgi:hypothetical protein